MQSCLLWVPRALDDLQVPETVPEGIPSASQVPFCDSDAVSQQLYSHKASSAWSGVGALS